MDRERELLDLARQHLRKAARRHARQSIRLRQLDAELALARQGQAAALDLVKRLESAGLDAQYLEERLAESQRLARALRGKSLERHQLLRQAQAALAPLEMWREEALRLEAESARLRGELEAAREQARSAEQRLTAAHLARDQASARLVSEQTARAQQALDLLEGQTLAVELAAAQGEAARWAQLAQALSQALVVMGAGQVGEPGQMGQQVESLTREAEDLRRQLRDISLLVALHLGQDNSRPGGPVGLRLSFRQPQQGERLLGRLGEVRSRLAKLGKGALGHWGVIAALTAGLTFIAPNTPSKATLQEAPLLPPRQELKHLSQELTLGQRNLVPAQAARLRQNLGAAELEMNLLPLRKKNGPLPAAVQRQVEAKARSAGLQPAVLITSARAVLGDQEVVDVALLDQLADTARGLAQRHPLIFQELSQEGLPRAAQALTALAPAREQGQHLFQDRIYREYRALGFSAEEALGALAANELAARAMKDAWRLPSNYQGQVRPVAAVEAMGLSTFMSRVTPYIQSRVEFFLRHQGGAFTGDVAAYSKDLAYDIYCAAKKFDVPVSLMLVIANQETSYANVLGDSNRSASPFQIFEPTRRLIVNSLEKQNFVPPPREIRLEHHLTMATYMAAFHVRELMQESIVNPGNGLGSHIDTDRVMKRYNGSNAYAPQVAQRQKQLTSFLALYGG